MRTCRMLNSAHNACPTFEGVSAVRVRVSNPMSGESFYLFVSNYHTLSDLKYEIAEELGAKSTSDIQIMFQSQVVGDDDCERSVIDFGVRDGSVIEVVRLVRKVDIVVFVHYMDSRYKPRRRREYGFPMVVPRNRPCAAFVKTEVMQRFDGERSPLRFGMQKMTNPHLFLLNYGLQQIRNTYSSVFSLGDKQSLDDFPGQAANPYEVYVIDETQCQCGTCDLAWMLDGWHCSQIWHTETSGFSDDDLSMNSDDLTMNSDDDLLWGTSSLGGAPVLSSSSSDGDAA